MQIVVVAYMSLDGVVQGPNRPGEDEEGGFAHGGWSQPFYDPQVLGPVFGEAMQGAGALLFGRNTWQTFADAWADRTDPFGKLMAGLPKYVVSSTLGDELTWNTTRIPGEKAVPEITKLHRAAGSEMVVLGSPRLVQALLAENLVDELRLMIEPVLLGGGKSLFPADGGLRTLELISTVTASTGVNVCTYRPVKPPTRIPVQLLQ